MLKVTLNDEATSWDKYESQSNIIGLGVIPETIRNLPSEDDLDLLKNSIFIDDKKRYSENVPDLIRNSSYFDNNSAYQESKTSFSSEYRRSSLFHDDRNESTYLKTDSIARRNSFNQNSRKDSIAPSVSPLLDSASSTLFNKNATKYENRIINCLTVIVVIMWILIVATLITVSVIGYLTPGDDPGYKCQTP